MVRRTNRNYLETTVNSDYKENSNKFWTYIKSKGQEATGVSPLKNKDSFIQSDAQSRANMLNSQFESAFTAENKTTIPDKGTSSVLTMASTQVDLKGVHKLLMNLKPHKATGPDTIPSFILKAAAT